MEFILNEEELTIINFLESEDLSLLYESGKLPKIPLQGYFMGRNFSFITKILGFQKFIKKLSLTEGCNLIVNQRVKKEVYSFNKERTNGLFNLYPISDSEFKVDYDFKKNSYFHPSRILEDFIVQVNVHGKDCLLGRGYLKGTKILGSYFILFPRKTDITIH